MSTNTALSLHEAAARSGVTIADGEPAVSRYVEAGVKLHYLDWGSADNPWMLCVHGSAQNAHMWDFTALAFRHRYHIVAIDQRGHGDSDWAPDAEYNRAAYVSDLGKVVDSLSMDSLVLMGLSLGGSNSVAYAAANPQRVRALVVVDVGPEPQVGAENAANDFVTQSDVLDSYEDFVQRVIAYSPHRPEWLIRSSLPHSLRQLPDGRWTWKYDSVLRDPVRRAQSAAARMDSASRWELWERVQCPTLIVRGEYSRMLSRDVADRMAQRNPYSQLIEVPKAGHRVPGDNPAAFEEAVRGFLDQNG